MQTIADSDSAAVALRDLPYPYDAMLAICSDLDETPSAECYLETSRYLNTNGRTSFGQGIQLEVGNTIYFHMNEGEFAYWNTTDSARSAIRDLIRSGHIDCMHSYGDTATRRSQVAETLAHLNDHGCRIRVWIDHAVARTNFGADIMQGFGDVPGDAAYHADLTLGYGVQYVWRGRVTSMHGQDAPPGIGGIWRPGEPVGSLVTLGKESAKICAAVLGSGKYGMHRRNKLLEEVVLRDSQPILEFLRSNPHPLGVSAGDNAAGLAAALSDGYLERLAKRRAKAIVYTHLGKQINPRSGFPAATRIALEKLAGRMQSRQILVATTERLLDYARLREGVSWTIRDAGDAREIVLDTPDRGRACDGLSFTIPAGSDYRIIRDGTPLQAERAELADAARSMLYVPWRRLDYGC
jgi:hypothetical protein